MMEDETAVREFTALKLTPKDNVATALRDLSAGSIPQVDGAEAPALADTIARGHKFALARILAGTEIVKYGHVIGTATRDIESGAHVHLHNIEGLAGKSER